MAYFPFFMDITGADCLIVGGGTVALRKVQKLLPYSPHITVISPELSPEICAIEGISILKRGFLPEDIDGRMFVIAATDDKSLNRSVAALCKDRRISVNSVDDRENCSFIFPSLVKRGELSIGISTGGASPTAAIYLKNQINALLPEEFPEILKFLDSLRGDVKARIPDEHRRAALFSRLFDECFEKKRPLTSSEYEALMGSLE